MKRTSALAQEGRTYAEFEKQLEAVAEQDLSFHMRQFEQPYRSTVALTKFIQRVASPVHGDALDVGCGAGALIHYLNRQILGLRWTGVDIAGKVLFPKSREFFERDRLDARLLCGDFSRLESVVDGARFDLVLCTQVVSYIAGYEDLLTQLMSVTRGWLFLSGLFTEFDIDVTIAASDYTWPEGVNGPYNYNVYGLPRFRSHCEKLGADRFLAEPFVIDIDLPAPGHGGLGTYTRLDAEGARMQFSGPIYLPWHFVAIHKS
jgi:SAM-dependent methyltransferase